MSEKEISLFPSKPTEVFMVLHEHHRRPVDREYEYQTGRLRTDLEQRAFGDPLSKKSIERLTELGSRLRGKALRAVVTEDFIVTRETARHLAAAAGLAEAMIVFDSRVRESDLSYLSAEQFRELGRREGAREANATLRDWMAHRPDDFLALRKGHVELWNDTLKSCDGEGVLYVLHVEGILLYTSLCLGLSASLMDRLLLPRNCPVHVTLAPDRAPTVCICDTDMWNGIIETPYAWYG